MMCHCSSAPVSLTDIQRRKKKKLHTSPRLTSHLRAAWDKESLSERRRESAEGRAPWWRLDTDSQTLYLRARAETICTYSTDRLINYNIWSFKPSQLQLHKLKNLKFVFVLLTQYFSFKSIFKQKKTFENVTWSSIITIINNIELQYNTNWSSTQVSWYNRIWTKSYRSSPNVQWSVVWDGPKWRRV